MLELLEQGAGSGQPIQSNRFGGVFRKQVRRSTHRYALDRRNSGGDAGHSFVVNIYEDYPVWDFFEKHLKIKN
jgi:hypothetical protein